MLSGASRFGNAFISYGSYHYNSVNKIIHIVCVPILTVTLFAMLGYLPGSISISGFKIGFAELFYVLTMAYYFYIHSLFGASMIILSAGVSFAWKSILAGSHPAWLFRTLIIVHVISWVFQFIGHGVFEKRKPALLDNLTQILIAPLFVLTQITILLGFTSEEVKSWEAQIKKNVEEYRKEAKLQ